MAVNLFVWPPHLGLRYFGNFEERQILEEVFQQKILEFYLTTQLFTSVFAKFWAYSLLASCNLLVWSYQCHLRREKHGLLNSPKLLQIELKQVFLKFNIKKTSTATLYINLFKQKVNRAIKTSIKRLCKIWWALFKRKFVSSVTVTKSEKARVLIWNIIK
jgi:hypothetical protein